jgi:hypothetical protein
VGEEYINPNVPADLALKQRIDAATEKLAALGFPKPEEATPEINKQRMANMIETAATMISGMMGGLDSIKQLESKPPPTDERQKQSDELEE